MLRHAALRVLLVSAACYGTAAGILNLALVAFAAAHRGVAWAGVLVAIWGTGSLAGGLVYGSRNWRRPVEDRAMACLVLFGATLMLLAAAPDPLIIVQRYRISVTCARLPRRHASCPGNQGLGKRGGGAGWRMSGPADSTTATRFYGYLTAAVQRCLADVFAGLRLARRMWLALIVPPSSRGRVNRDGDG